VREGIKRVGVGGGGVRDGCQRGGFQTGVNGELFDAIAFAESEVRGSKGTHST
jgi:hypothetical protein